MFALLVCGVIIEAIKIPLSSLKADLDDFGTDVVGILVGWYLVRRRLGGWCIWLENQPGK